MQQLEQEFKWDASARGAFSAFLRALKQGGELSRVRRLAIRDYYLDNARQDFTRDKVALRIRRTGKRFEATLKTRNAVKNGFASRRELTLPLSNVRSMRGALARLEQRGDWEGYALEGLQVRFCIANQRAAYQWKAGGCVCEAALDNYVTLAKGYQWRRKEIELELKKGSVKTYQKLAQKLSVLSALSAAKISKVAGAEQWLKTKVSKS